MSGAAPPSENLYVVGLPTDMDDATLRQVFEQYGSVASCRPLAPKAGGQDIAAMVRMATLEEATWLVDNLNGGIPQGLTAPVQVRYAAAKTADKGGSWDGGKGGGKDQGGWAGGKGSDQYAPYGSSSKGKGFDKGGDKGKGKGKGLGEAGIKAVVKGLYNSGALPGGNNYTNDDKTLFLAGLPRDTTDLHLYQMLSPFGSVAPNGITAMKDKETGQCKGFGFCNFLDPSATQRACDTLNGCVLPDGKSLKVTIKQEAVAKPPGDAAKGGGKSAKGKSDAGKGYVDGGKGWGKPAPAGKGKW